MWLLECLALARQQSYPNPCRALRTVRFTDRKNGLFPSAKPLVFQRIAPYSIAFQISIGRLLHPSVQMIAGPKHNLLRQCLEHKRSLLQPPLCAAKPNNIWLPTYPVTCCESTETSEPIGIAPFTGECVGLLLCLYDSTACG